MPYFENDGCKFYFEMGGTGEPLLLLHGLAADNASWLSVRALLEKSFTLIMPDNRFSGRSKAPANCKADMRTLAVDAKALLDHLGVKKAAVVGHSMGGMVAQEFALAFPDFTDALILESTSAAPIKRNEALFDALGAALKKDGYTENFWRLMFPWLLSTTLYHERPDFAELAIRAAAGYPYLPTPENFVRMAGMIAAHNCTDRLKEIKSRTLVLAGGKDLLIPAEEGRALADGIPGARFAFAKDAGHVVHLELPDVFTQAVTVFLTGK